MISHFKKFEGSPNGKNKDRARITLSPRRFFALNPKAHLILGRPDAVELFFDDHERLVGMLACDPLKRNAFRIRNEKGKEYRVIYAAAFCRHFSISTDRTVLFDQIDVTKDGMLVLDMKKAIRIGRGSR